MPSCHNVDANFTMHQEKKIQTQMHAQHTCHPNFWDNEDIQYDDQDDAECQWSNCERWTNTMVPDMRIKVCKQIVW